MENYQYEVATLLHQATLIGIDQQEFNIPDVPVNAIYKYAMCIQERSSAANTPLVRFIWNMWPFNLNPFVSYFLDLCACPCCWWIYPCDQLFIVFPWNTLVFIIIVASSASVITFLPIYIAFASLTCLTGAIAAVSSCLLAVLCWPCVCAWTILELCIQVLTTSSGTASSTSSSATQQAIANWLST